MDKFLIDPPDNITIDKVDVPTEIVESSETPIPTGPPPIVEPPIVEPPIVEPPIVEPISTNTLSIPQETSDVETGPPPTVIKESMEDTTMLSPIEEPVNETLTGETLLPVIKESIEEPVKFSFTRWILWILILVLFIVLALYYAIKYTLNESGYLIKKNAKGYKISLEEMKSDIKKWLRSWIEGIQEWNENLSNKTNQFFFRQHVNNGTFKTTKYKIPKNLITPTQKD